MDVYEDYGYILATPAGAQWVRAADVSDGFFRTLGVVPRWGVIFMQGRICRRRRGVCC